MKAALVVNAYDAGNWGDAAIVEGLISSLRSVGFDHIAVAPVDWAHGAARWEALGADSVVRPLVSLRDVPSWLRRPRAAMLGYVLARLARMWIRWPPDEAVASYRQADLVVSAGGAYLGGSKAGGNFLKVVGIRAGRVAGRPTIVAPMTVSPSSRLVGALLRWGLAGSTVFARDDATQAVLARSGVASIRVPDIAIRASSLRRARAELVPPSSRSAVGVIGWAPRGYRADHSAWGQPDEAETITLEAVRQLLRSPGQRLRLFAHVSAGPFDDDAVAVERVLARFSPEERLDVEVAPRSSTLLEAIGAYASLDVLITSRMHAAIFALSVGTPAVAVGYEPKVLGVMTDLGLADRVIPAEASLRADDVVSLVQRLRADGERQRTLAAFDLAQERFDDLDAALSRSHLVGSRP